MAEHSHTHTHDGITHTHEHSHADGHRGQASLLPGLTEGALKTTRSEMRCGVKSPADSGGAVDGNRSGAVWFSERRPVKNRESSAMPSSQKEGP